jgi:exosortase family protein XrtF
LFGRNASSELNTNQPNIKFFYNQKFVARIIEGCNALSIIILFIAFIVAFTGKLRTTILYIITGSVLIHILNIARIALLVVGLYHFPEQESFIHGVIFPLFIYSVVFVLWVIWVNKFSLYAK